MRTTLVTGASGFVGRAIMERLGPDATGISSTDVDLRDAVATRELFVEVAPQVVVHAAAVVGGITANTSRSADFLVDNALIDASVLGAVRACRPAHFMPLLSTCMYPDRLPDDRYPLDEHAVEDGPPPPTNAAYAQAKRTLHRGGIELARQYGIGYTGVTPSNIYGPGDHFGEHDSHFVAAAIHRTEVARRTGAPTVEFLGTGRPLRQYVHVDDVAEVVARVVDREPIDDMVNVAPVANRSIADLARGVANACSYDGSVTFSGAGPDGQYRKDVATDRLRHLLPAWADIETPLDEGLRQTVDWYREHVATG